jgi:hypothetical protein
VGLRAPRRRGGHRHGHRRTPRCRTVFDRSPVGQPMAAGRAVRHCRGDDRLLRGAVVAGRARTRGAPPLGTAIAAYYRSQFLSGALPGGVLGDVHRGVRHGRDAGDLGRGLPAVLGSAAPGRSSGCGGPRRTRRHFLDRRARRALENANRSAVPLGDARSAGGSAADEYRRMGTSRRRRRLGILPLRAERCAGSRHRHHVRYAGDRR